MLIILMYFFLQPKSKKFIDRKHSVTFHLVHRSQQDPLTADETAPQRVLLPVTEKPKVVCGCFNELLIIIIYFNLNQFIALFFIFYLF